MTSQQGDVRLYQTDDGGDIDIENGLFVMTGGLETAAYLSLFGGNEDDDGRELCPYNWWGNIAEERPERRYRSETQHLLQALPATTGNLRAVEDAATRDLEWFKSVKAASRVSVAASIPGVNRLKLTIEIEAEGIATRFEFVENWKAAQ